MDENKEDKISFNIELSDVGWVVLNAFVRIIWPPFWDQQDQTNYYWDKKVRWLIKNGKKWRMKNNLTLVVDEYEIWTGNFPYWYGYHRDMNTGLPCILTRYLLNSAIHKKLYENK